MATVQVRRGNSVTCYIPAELYKRAEIRTQPRSTGIALWLIVAGVWAYDLIVGAHHMIG
jgi:hypothetical protein